MGLTKEKIISRYNELIYSDYLSFSQFTVLFRKGVYYTVCLLGICVTILLLAGCSDVLNPVFTLLAPEFSITTQPTAQGVMIDFSGARDGSLTVAEATKDKEDKNNYRLLYAYYLFRSEQNPYEGYKLITRLYNPNAAKDYTDRTYKVVTEDGRDVLKEERTLQDYDLRSGFYKDALNLRYENQKRLEDKSAVIGRTYYYRVVRVEFEREQKEVKFAINGGEQTRTEIRHTLKHDNASGWSSAVSGGTGDTTTGGGTGGGLYQDSLNFGTATASIRYSLTSGTTAQQWRAVENASWLSVSPASGSVGANQPFSLNLTVTRTGLSAGDYQTVLTVEADGYDDYSILVKMSVGDFLINPQQQTVSFGASETTKTVSFTTQGSGKVIWNASKSQAWLTLSKTKDSLEAGNGFAFNATVNRAGLTKGTYTDTVVVSTGGRFPVVAIVEMVVPVTVGSWSKVSGGLPVGINESIDVGALYSYNGNLFAGMNRMFPASGSASIGGGVYRSSNGTSWTKVSNGIATDQSTTAEVLSFTSQSSTLFAGTTKGLYRTTNTGSNWSLVSGGLPPDRIVRCLTAQGTSLFAGFADSGVYRSTNTGGAWTATRNGLPAGRLNATAFTATAGIILADIQSPTARGIYRSTNGGGGWTLCPLTTPLSASIQLATDNSTFYVSVDKTLYASTDGGVSWTQRFSFSATVTALGFFSEALAGVFFGGTYLSANASSSWSANGLDGLKPAAFAAFNGYFYSATNEGVWRRLP